MYETLTGASRRRLALAAIGCTALVAGLVSGCGDDDGDDASGDSEPATLEITASEGSDGAPQLDVPGSAAAGVTEITLANEGKQPYAVGLARVEGERSEQEVVDALKAAISGKPFPDWFFAGAGTGYAPPGESTVVVQELRASSTYWAFPETQDDGPPEPPAGAIEISGEAGEATLPATSSVISAVDFGFETGDIEAGEPITFRNEGVQPHHIVSFPFADEDATLEQVEAFLAAGPKAEGPPPVDFDGFASTAVLDGGDEQVSDLTLESGRYALVCFISNREGGPPHIELGMLDEVEVE